MKEFELFEHTADVGVRGFGRTVEEAFENTAKAMMSVMFDLKTIEPKREIEIECSAGSIDELLVAFLNEVLSMIDIEGLVLREFRVSINENKLTCVAKGEEFKPEKHHPKTEVKAATYSQLKVFKNDGYWVAQCIVDV